VQFRAAVDDGEIVVAKPHRDGCFLARKIHGGLADVVQAVEMT
jgi:hypothetical protein